MLTAIIYLISTVIIGLFAYKCYSVGYGKKIENPFANYLFFSSLFITFSYLTGFILVFLAVYTANDVFIFIYNFLARIFFYTSAVFSVQVPLYKFYPNDKRRYIFSYLVAAIGIGLLIYQSFNIVHPTINPSGIVNWKTDIVLSMGMACLMIIPWAATSIIFIREFIKGKFQSPKPFFIGFGFFFICLGGFFADAFSAVNLYIISNSAMILGFLFCLAGMFYSENQ